MAAQKLFLAALVGSASAVKLYVSNYATTGPNGSVTTLDFTPGVGAAKLQQVSANVDCGSEPTWLDNSVSSSKVYCVDEGWLTPNASLNTLSVGADGKLTRVGKVDTIQGPVSTQFYNKNAAVALAHYGGSAISTFKLSADGTTFTPLQNFTFNTPPGPRPEQEASHPHHSVIDPTGKFIIFPDLGSDVVRIYSIDPATSLLKEEKSFPSKPASGPRHAAFWTSPGKRYGGRKPDTYLFVVHELSNRLVSYAVSYPEAGGLSLREVKEVPLYDPKTKEPVGTRAAEVAVSPDNQFVVVSNRNATVFNVPNGDAMIPSDSLATFKPSPDGNLEFVQLAPSGGSFPRHFKFNKDGSLIAVANQNSQNVHIWARDVKTGLIGEKLAAVFNMPGNVTSVVWDEQRRH